MPKVEDSIRIIKTNDYKQIQFSLALGTHALLLEDNVIKISYENMYGEKYEQKYDFKVSEAFTCVISIDFNKPFKIG